MYYSSYYDDNHMLHAGFPQYIAKDYRTVHYVDLLSASSRITFYKQNSNNSPYFIASLFSYSRNNTHSSCNYWNRNNIEEVYSCLESIDRR